jgi:hypothetical protein
MVKMHKFTIRLPNPTWAENSPTVTRSPAVVEAFEMDIVDGALVFSGPNRGGYVAGFAPGEWVSVTSGDAV